MVVLDIQAPGSVSLFTFEFWKCCHCCSITYSKLKCICEHTNVYYWRTEITFFRPRSVWTWVWKGHGRDILKSYIFHSAEFFYSLVLSVDFWAKVTLVSILHLKWKCMTLVWHFKSHFCSVVILKLSLLIVKCCVFYFDLLWSCVFLYWVSAFSV
jgi:hypothetical protein